MINFIQSYPKDSTTQEKLCTELLKHFEKLEFRPDLIFDKRFLFLLSYFELNGSAEIKNLCVYWRKQVG